METTGIQNIRKHGVVTLLLLFFMLPAHGAPKTDVIIFKNGDRLTGEVKSLERGRLRFNTDATGTISIEWDDIASLESEQNIEVETEEGRRYLEAGTGPGDAATADSNPHGLRKTSWGIRPQPEMGASRGLILGAELLREQTGCAGR